MRMIVKQETHLLSFPTEANEESATGAGETIHFLVKTLPSSLFSSTPLSSISFRTTEFCWDLLWALVPPTIGKHCPPVYIEPLSYGNMWRSFPSSFPQSHGTWKGSIWIERKKRDGHISVVRSVFPATFCFFSRPSSSYIRPSGFIFFFLFQRI